MYLFLMCRGVHYCRKHTRARLAMQQLSPKLPEKYCEQKSASKARLDNARDHIRITAIYLREAE